MKSSVRRFPEWQFDAVPEEAHVPRGVRVAEAMLHVEVKSIRIVDLINISSA
jgi:hypothetical protein